MISVIIPAAGQGKRFGAGINKAFVSLAGKTILERTVAAFSDLTEVSEIIIVIAPDELDEIKRQVKFYPRQDIIKVVAGGAERQYSVENALAAIRDDAEIVLIHDGARPLISRRVIHQVIKAVRDNSAAIVAVPVKDTIKVVDSGGFVTSTPVRSELWAVQTPQGFKRSLLIQAYKKAREENFLGTDDSSLVERLGIPVKIVPGEYENIKITTPEDLPIAKMIFTENRERDLL